MTTSSICLTMMAAMALAWTRARLSMPARSP
jgi:hypothetical protein